MKNYLAYTDLLDFQNPSIRALIAARDWAVLPPAQRIDAIYRFVQSEILFGYNDRDELTASRVLADGMGQCNTKTILVMALLRAAGVPCRLRGLWVEKPLQRGIIPPLFYPFTPRLVLHSWAEVWLNGRWFALEGIILDAAYLTGLQQRLGEGPVYSWAAAVDDLADPPVDFGEGRDTFIQKGAVVEDLGTFRDPDSFFQSYSQQFTGLRGFAYRHVVRKWMNRRAEGVRRGTQPRRATGRFGFSKTTVQYHNDGSLPPA